MVKGDEEKSGGFPPLESHKEVKQSKVLTPNKLLTRLPVL